MSAVLLAAPLIQAEDLQQLTELEIRELLSLENAVRGYLTITFPAGYANACTVEVAQPVKKKSEPNRSWYSMTFKSKCGSAAVDEWDAWFYCVQRDDVTCKSTLPPDLKSGH